MFELDGLDKRILYELDCNSRISYSELARKIRQGRDRVEYRVQKLVENKIINKCFTSINLSKIGFTIYKTYLRLENNRPRVAEFVSFLRNHNRVFWLCTCDGGWDLIICILARSPREFYDVHSEILSKFNELVLNFSAYSLVEYKTYSRNYFNKGHRIIKIGGGAPESIEIDRLDIKILRLLTQNSRMSNIEIAHKVKSTAATVNYRIQKLEASHVINGYQLDISLSALNMQMFKLQLFIRDYRLELRKQFIEYCNHHPNIIFYLEQIGDVNIELELEVKDYQDFAKILDDIRGRFSRLIRNFNTMMIRESWYWPMPNMIKAP